MRDIKFRAWDKSGKRYEGSEVCLMGDLVIKSSYSATRWVEEAQLFNLCQYTGMKDVNGVEIYEGDILQSEHFFRYQVVFKGDCWRCESLKNKGFKNRFIGRDLKVIGNIWEDGDLIDSE